MDIVLSYFRDSWFCIPQKQKQKRIPPWAKPRLVWMARAFYSWQAREQTQILQRCGLGHPCLWVLLLSSHSPFSASIYRGGEEARPDGICHKMLLQYWQSAFLIVVLSKRQSWEFFAVSDIVQIWHKMNSGQQYHIIPHLWATWTYSPLIFSCCVQWKWSICFYFRRL